MLRKEYLIRIDFVLINTILPGEAGIVKQEGNKTLLFKEQECLRVYF